MNEIIKNLLNEFSDLTPPINPLILKEIFEKHPLNDELYSSDFKEHVDLLTRLKQLSQNFFDSTKQLDAFNQRQNNFTHLMKQKETISAHVLELKSNIEQLNQKLLTLYKHIETTINEARLSDDPLAAELKHTQYEEMKAMISERSLELSTLCKDIDERKAKSSLALQLAQFNNLTTELENANIGYSHTTNEQQVKQIALKINTAIDQLAEHSASAQRLQTAFAQRLSVEDLHLKRSELETESSRLMSQQQVLSAQISSFRLTDSEKKKLTMEFNNSEDKKKLISNYDSQIDSAWDYINPVAWLSWGVNLVTLNNDKEKHQQEQLTLQHSVEFLKLLHQHFLNEAKHVDTEANKLLLEKAMPKTETNDENPKNTEMPSKHDSLIDDTIKLFNTLHEFISIIELQPDSSEADFYLTLLLNMPHISNELEKKSRILNVINEIIPLYGEIERLRTEYGLLAEYDHLLPDLQTAEQESQLLREQAPLRENYQEQLNLCGTYQYGVQELDALALTLEQSRKKLKQLQANLRRPENKAPNNSEIETLNTLLLAINDTINIKFNQLTALQYSLKAVAATLYDSEPYVLSTYDAPSYGDDEPDVLADITSLTPPEQELLTTPDQPPLAVQKIKPGQQSSSEEVLSDAVAISEDSEFIPEPALIKKETSQVVSSHDEQESDAAEHLYSEEQELDSSTTDSSEQPDDTEAENNLQEDEHSEVPNVIPPISAISAPAPQKPPIIDEEELSNTSTSDDFLEDAYISTGSEYSASDTGTKITATAVHIDSSLNIQDLTNQYDNQSPTDNSLTSSELETDQTERDDVPQKLTPRQINLANIEKWHNEARTYVLSQDDSIQKWYGEVYKTLKKVQNTEESGYKAAHVIRDILFELEHHKNSEVLNAYMRLCPNPDQDVYKLLALKPSLWINESAMDSIEQVLNCPTQLKKYYNHYSQLKTSHPIEAELFLQAVRSVHTLIDISKLPNHNMIADQIPSLADDPRYAPLKRHRGFLQIWEMLEDLCRLIIGKFSGQQEYEYSRRPCFFNTRSNQLIKEADTLIQDLLPNNPDNLHVSL